MAKTIDKQKAIIAFERPSAARTAILLQDAHLGTSQVHVSSSEPLEGSSTPPSTEKAKPDTDFSQEDKPRTAVFAEYLSQGYTLSDQILHKAIEYDHKNGISARFHAALNSFLTHAHAADQKYGVTQRAIAVDEKYGIQDRAKQTATGLMRYFENALDTPTGKKVRSFYDDRRKEVLEIHAEARRYAHSRPFRFTLHLWVKANVRLADERKATAQSTSDTSAPEPTAALSATAPTSEKTA